MKYNKKGEEYISAFPKFKKWINECSCCHAKGYNPSMPTHIGLDEGSLGAYYIKKYFNPLEIDDEGFCNVCSGRFKHK